MKFLIDNQLPISLTNFIRDKGFEAKHVIELSLDGASDKRIFNLAQDEDFFI